MTAMTTILGAGGPIGNELAKILASSNQRFRLGAANQHQLPERKSLQRTLPIGSSVSRRSPG